MRGRRLESDPDPDRADPGVRLAKKAVPRRTAGPLPGLPDPYWRRSGREVAGERIPALRDERMGSLQCFQVRQAGRQGGTASGGNRGRLIVLCLSWPWPAAALRVARHVIGQGAS